MSKLLTANEAGDLLGLSRDAIYEECRKGRLPHLRIGQRVRIPADQLEKWIRDRVEASLVQ